MKKIHYYGFIVTVMVVSIPFFVAADFVPGGIIIAWPAASSTGAVAQQIPSGWYRDESLDTYFLRMAAATTTNPGATGGVSSHSHNIPDHNHTQDAHSHTSNSVSGAPSATIAKHTSGGDNLLSTGDHTHTVPNSSSDAATNQGAGALTSSSDANIPPYREVLWIYAQATGTPGIPNDAIAFLASSTIPSGWTATTTGLFYRGAPASMNPDAATQGSDTHTHTASHNHTQDSHTHTSAASGSDAGANDAGTSNPANSSPAHSHGITWGGTTATNQAADANIQAASNWPPYYGLVAVDNDASRDLLATGTVAVWRGGKDALPADWWFLDGIEGRIDLRDRFITATTTANFGNTGGSSATNHAAAIHTHIQDSHTHALTLDDAGTTAQKRTNNNSGPTGADDVHTHSSTSAAATATNQNTTVTVDAAAETRPPFFELAFVQHIPVRYKQSAYRVFMNTDTLDVGSVLAAQDTAATLTSAGQAFRIRVLLHVEDATSTTKREFKLQFAGKGAGSCASPAGTPTNWTDVDGATAVAFNAQTPADGDALTANVNDPTHNGHTVQIQSYEEANNVVTLATTTPNQDMKWDFALIDNSAPAGTTYCFRMIKSDGDTLQIYDVYPEITIFSVAPTSDVQQIHYRFRQDTVAEGENSAWLGAENATSSTDRGGVTRLRIEVSNEGSATSDKTRFQLQSGIARNKGSGLGCSAVLSWMPVGEAGSTTPDWAMSPSNFLSDAASTTDFSGSLTNENTTFVGGAQKDQNNQTIYAELSTLNYTEHEFSLLAASSTVNIGTTFCFRLVDGTTGATQNFTYVQYPATTITRPANVAGGTTVEDGPSGTPQGGGIQQGSGLGSGGTEPTPPGTPSGGGVIPGGGGGSGESGFIPFLKGVLFAALPFVFRSW